MSRISVIDKAKLRRLRVVATDYAAGPPAVQSTIAVSVYDGLGAPVLAGERVEFVSPQIQQTIAGTQPTLSLVTGTVMVVQSRDSGAPGSYTSVGAVISGLTDANGQVTLRLTHGGGGLLMNNITVRCGNAEVLVTALQT